MKKPESTTKMKYLPPLTEISEVFAGQLVCASVESLITIENLQLDDEFTNWS